MAQLISPPQPKSDWLFTLDFKSVRLTAEQFRRLCQDNPDIRLELTSRGELIVMPPTGSKTGIRNCNLTSQLAQWAEADRSGFAFDSSTGYTLPNGAVRSPDASWIRRERWERLSEEQQESFAPISPDFVIELLSPADILRTLQQKMLEYIENGVELGFLIDPFQRQIFVYSARQSVAVLQRPEIVSGEPVLSGFALKLDEFW